MELKLPNRSGIEILGIFDIERIRIPIIICTTLVNEEKSFEVQMYYKQKFLVKDEKLPVRELMEAADEFCPREKDDDIDLSLEDDDVAEPELSEEMKAELNKAKEIQRNLMPKQFPAMPGYELQAFYQPYDQVGGDYYDVIPIDNDHVVFWLRRFWTRYFRCYGYGYGSFSNSYVCKFYYFASSVARR